MYFLYILCKFWRALRHYLFKYCLSFSVSIMSITYALCLLIPSFMFPDLSFIHIFHLLSLYARFCIIHQFSSIALIYSSGVFNVMLKFSFEFFISMIAFKILIKIFSLLFFDTPFSLFSLFSSKIASWIQFYYIHFLISQYSNLLGSCICYLSFLLMLPYRSLLLLVFDNFLLELFFAST